MNYFTFYNNESSMAVLPVFEKRGIVFPIRFVLSANQAYPTDPIGNFTLSLTNLALNSAIQVQAQDGTPIYNGTADTSTKILNLQAYAPGSPLNDLIIKVRKGSSAPYYQPWSTQTTAIKGSQTIFVSQIPDE